MRALETQDSRVPGGDGEGGVAIRVRGLRRLYGGVEAVRGVGLTVCTGEIFAFLVPNGAGRRRPSRRWRVTGTATPVSGQYMDASGRDGTRIMQNLAFEVARSTAG